MKTHRYLHLAIVAVAAFVVLRVVGISAGALVLLALVGGCALMMFFMMRNMGGMNHSDDHHQDHQHRV